MIVSCVAKSASLLPMSKLYRTSAPTKKGPATLKCTCAAGANVMCVLEFEALPTDPL